MNPGVDSGAGVVLALLAAVLAVAIYVWVALALAAAFRKMGEEPWQAWVPVLNVAVLLRWGGFSPWLALLGVIPVVGPFAVWVLLVLTVHRLNPGFGYGAGMTAVGALLFPVWATIVGFGPAEWRGARPAHLRERALPQPASPPYPPFGSLATDFGAPLPPPPFPAAAQTAEPPRVEPAAASVDPQPWTPAVPGASAPEELSSRTDPSVTSSGLLQEQPDPTAPTPTIGRAAQAPTPAEAAGGASPVIPAATAERSVSPPVPASRPEIISSVPGRDEPPAMRLRRPAAGPDRDESDVFPELTGEVSAVPGSPAAGAPVSATSSVSAQEREREEAAAPSWTDEVERTVVVRRGRPSWELVLPDGSSVALTGDVVVLGRNPRADPSRPHAQLIVIVDATRTVSKTHARLERRGETWRIIDLGSTNGILLPSPLGTDIEVGPGDAAEVTDRFLLGDAALRLQRTDAGS